MAVIDKAWLLQQEGPGLTKSRVGGFVPDDDWSAYQGAIQSVNQELGAISYEANQLRPNWSQTIFQQASEILAVEKRKKMREERVKKVERDKRMEKKRQEKKQQHETSIAQQKRQKREKDADLAYAQLMKDEEQRNMKKEKIKATKMKFQ